jgi:hypothetical protein
MSDDIPLPPGSTTAAAIADRFRRRDEGVTDIRGDEDRPAAEMAL